MRFIYAFLAKLLLAIGLVSFGLILAMMPGWAVEEETLERIEADLTYTDYDSADSLFDLEPISIEDRIVDVELFSDPNPRRRLDVINQGLEEQNEARGLEIIEFSLPVE